VPNDRYGSIAHKEGGKVRKKLAIVAGMVFSISFAYMDAFLYDRDPISFFSAATLLLVNVFLFTIGLLAKRVIEKKKWRAFIDLPHILLRAWIIVFLCIVFCFGCFIAFINGSTPMFLLLGGLLFILRSWMKRFTRMGWSVFLTSWNVSLVCTMVFSMIFGYIGNRIYPNRIENFAKTIPIEIKEFKNNDQMVISENIKKFLRNSASIQQRFPISIILGEDGFLFLYKKYSLTEECKYDMFYLKDMKWRFCVERYG
jgi:hypothetical protein